MNTNLNLLALSLTSALTLSASAHAQDLVVKIGHVAPLSGQSAHMGKDTEDGARLAIEELNAKNIKIGSSVARFELLGEDDGSDPKQATAAAQKLVDAKVNGVIGHMNSGTTIPASKIYNTAGIPQISPSATNPKYTQQGFNTAFRVVANDGQLGGTLGRYAVQVNQAKNIAVIDDRTAYGQGVADEFVKGATGKAKSVSIVARQYTTDKATDFSSILTQIKSKNPDVVFFGGMDAVGGPILRQMKQLGIEAKFMGGDGICSTELARLAGDAIGEGKVVCAEAGGVEEGKKAELEAFRTRFSKRFGHEVVLNAPYAYDAVMVMVAAMQKAGSAEPANYLPELAKVNYKGVTGTIAFDKNGDIVNGTLTLYTYKNGKREVITVTK
ncbi:branched-chain amino acid ABC transporter substrate-binding protein [Noviherbaspirillum sp. Root189]|uniref:branched-chain amino acid ABC transporter substrate-binding protein n=1 Tax=Noviherbaspirillum sp. Root189 TaxID=1736487 RepID=UPI00070EDA4F|nr:branched-chain amino acid ABC transporter substrate-binding protein [Noviherbaspirillum sp. Root189]KRB72973.1 branched-chain amino acid ABC transporter substrate-binding protein [Noviherbaspirillum sp. Root189]